MDIISGALKSGILALCIALIDQCILDYTLEGWKDLTWM